jgi:hypothetical protein
MLRSLIQLNEDLLKNKKKKGFKMSLSLGKSFNRNYNLRLPFLSGNYNIEIYFNKNSPFLLYGVKPDFSKNDMISNHGIKINMFKNLESSRFCEMFINLHNYRSQNLDISNQYDSIKDDYFTDISFLLNESIILSKHNINDKEVFDLLNIYGMTMISQLNEFFFIISERHHINKKIGKKIVRTTGIQISTSHSLNILDEYHDDFKLHLKNQKIINKKINKVDSNKIVKLTDVNEEN